MIVRTSPNGWATPVGDVHPACATLIGAMRILVVEDERKVANFIRQGLQEEGHAVEVAGDGVEALDWLLAEPSYDLVVLDRQPVKNVEEMKSLIQKHRAGTPTLFLVHRDGGNLYVPVG